MLIHEVGSLCCASNAEEVWHNIHRNIKGLLQCKYTHHDNLFNSIHKLGMYLFCGYAHALLLYLVVEADTGHRRLRDVVYSNLHIVNACLLCSSKYMAGCPL